MCCHSGVVIIFVSYRHSTFSQIHTFRWTNQRMYAFKTKTTLLDFSFNSCAPDVLFGGAKLVVI